MSLKGISKRECSRLASCSSNYANTWGLSDILSSFSRFFDNNVNKDLNFIVFSCFHIFCRLQIWISRFPIFLSSSHSSQTSSCFCHLHPFQSSAVTLPNHPFIFPISNQTSSHFLIQSFSVDFTPMVLSLLAEEYSRPVNEKHKKLELKHFHFIEN